MSTNNILVSDVPIGTSLTANDPVIETEPVNSCVLVSNDPFLVDPVTKSMDDVIVWATIVCAVNVPLTVKSLADDAVAAYEADTAFSTYDALWAFNIYDAVSAFDAVNAKAAYDELTAFKT